MFAPAVLAAALALSPARAAAAEERPAKLWTGQGETTKASEAANWFMGQLPGDGDWAVFGSMSNKDCDWDLAVKLGNLSLSPAYRGRFRLAASRLDVAGEVDVAGGAFDVGAGTLSGMRRLIVDGGGEFELNGGEVRLGPSGVLVVEDGSLLSTGDRPARIGSATGEPYPFIVKSGRIRLDNPAGTVIEKSQGLVVGEKVEIDAARDVHMREVDKGQPAVQLFRREGQRAALVGWSFDESASMPLSAPKGGVILASSEADAEAFLREGSSLRQKLRASGTGERRVWTGAGETSRASDPSNWKNGAPGSSDTAVFGGRSDRECDWDLPAAASIQLERGFAGMVRVATAAWVAGEVAVLGGKLELGSGELTARRVRVGFGASFDLGRGVLRLGPGGLWLDGGEVSSPGPSAPQVAAARPGEAYPLVFDRGGLRIRALRLDGSSGISVRAGAAIEQFDGVEVTKHSGPAAALRLFANETVELELRGWTLDESVAENVDASGLPPMSRLVLKDFKGPGMGSARGRDPHVLVRWDPDAPKPDASSASYQEPEAERLRGKVAFSPLVDVEMLGGQYFFEGSQGALSGNARVLASGRVKHPLYPEWTFVPLYSGLYRGTKQVTDLVGGGTLFQETMEHRLAVKAIYEPAPKWRVKPEVGYKVQFLKETRDETWTNGLFDHRRPGLGLEVEHTWKDPFRWRAGYDFYQINFPNYVSLESQAKGTAGLARQLAGSKTIDSTNHSLTFAGSAPGPARTLLEGSLNATLRGFGDQHLVDATGGLVSDTRSDLVTGLQLSWKAPRRPREALKLVAGVDVNAARVRSNQDSYDAQRVKYLPDYYDTDQWQVGANVAAFWGLQGETPVEARLGVAAGKTSYKGRPVQDASGAYGADMIDTTESYLYGTFRYPIADRFHWTGTLQYGKQSSNMGFEKLYRYNFSTFAYLMGVSWEY